MGKGRGESPRGFMDFRDLCSVPILGVDVDESVFQKCLGKVIQISSACEWLSAENALCVVR